MRAALLPSSVLTGAPGQAVGCDVHLTNPTMHRVTLVLGVEGPAAEWAVVLPPELVLSPGASGRARVTFTLPHGERLAGSTRPFAVRVSGGEPVELAGRLDIADVQDLRVSIRPLVTRARRATTHAVTVENRGSRPSTVALVAWGAAEDLRLQLVADRVTVAPGEQATVALTVNSRRRVLTGHPRPHPFTVEARPETGPAVAALATRFQEPVRWRGGAVATLAVAVVTAGALAWRGGGPSEGIPPAGASAKTVAVPAVCATAASGGTVSLDIAGFAFCPNAATVATGSDVLWTNADLSPHTVTFDGPDGPVDSGSMAQGQSWSTRFAQPGTYQYVCRFHPGMSGTIVVRAAVSS